MKFGAAAPRQAKADRAADLEPASMLDILALGATAALAYVYTMRPQSRG